MGREGLSYQRQSWVESCSGRAGAVAWAPSSVPGLQLPTVPQEPDTTPTPSSEPNTGLSHIQASPRGPESCMVDVGGKPHTEREAVAEARVRFPAGLLEGLLAEGGPKGPITEVARAAGVLAAKRTGDLIPMCHPLGLNAVDLSFEPLEHEPDVLRIVCRSACHGPTGVEMEAMTGASVAALTIYDMTKALTKGIEIERVRLLSKKGGKSGEWRAGERG